MDEVGRDEVVGSVEAEGRLKPSMDIFVRNLFLHLRYFMQFLVVCSGISSLIAHSKTKCFLVQFMEKAREVFLTTTRTNQASKVNLYRYIHNEESKEPKKDRMPDPQRKFASLNAGCTTSDHLSFTSTLPPAFCIYAVDKSRAWTLSVTSQEKVSLTTLRSCSALKELK